MESLMSFADVAELLELDARDEKRNRMFLGAVSEQICLYLDRNLLTGTTTEQLKTYGCEIAPHEYPVREITALIDARTGESLILAPNIKIKDISRPDAHRQPFYKIEGKDDREVLITYRYGYDPSEMPLLIQETVLTMMRDRLIMCGKTTAEETQSMDKDRLMNIAVYRRLFLR